MLGGLYYIDNFAKTDNYQTLTGIVTNMQIIQSGHVPFGAFWLFNYYGGSIATFFHVAFMPNIGDTSLLGISLITNDPILAFKILVCAFLFVSQFCAYKFAKFFFQKTSIAWIFSLSYSFSTFYFSHINNGVIEFIAAAALLPGVLLLFEKMFVSPNRKNMVFATFALTMLFFCDLQMTIFSIFYLALRIVYFVATYQNKDMKITLLKRLGEGVTLFALSIAPFIISFSKLQNVAALSVPAIPWYYLVAPSYYFQRIVHVTYTEPGSYYIGLFMLVFAFLPLVVYKKQNKVNNRNFLFFLLIVVFFILIAIGTPLSTLATSLFIRVPARDSILIDLSIYMCAGYGLLFLSELIKQKLPKGHWINKSKLFHTFIVVVVAAIVLMDLTAGVAPVTNAVPQFTGGDNFIKNQHGNFRVLEYPLIWGYSDYESVLLNHEIIGMSVIALRAYPPNSQLFSNLSNTFQNISLNLTVNAANLTLLATLCGAKYVLIQTNVCGSISYVNYFNNATQYFTLVYKDNDSVVYENLYFKGIAFAVKDTGSIPNLTNLTIDEFSNISLPNAEINCTESFNRIEISANVSEPAYVILSQSYYPNWVLTNTGNSPAFMQFLNVSVVHVEAGVTTVNAVFSATDQTWYLYACCFIPLALLGLVIYADSKTKKELFKLGLASLLVFGVFLASLSFLGTTMAPSFLPKWLGFGVFNKLLLELGSVIAFGSLLIFFKDTLFALPGLSWLDNQKSPKTLSSTDKHPNRVFKRISQLGNQVSIKLKRKLMPLEGLIQNLLWTLVVTFLLFIFLANIPGLFSDATSFLNYSVLGVIICASILYVTKVFFLENGGGPLPMTAQESECSKSVTAKQDSHIGHLHLGVCGGLVGVFVSGLLMHVLSSYSQGVCFSGFVLCGVLCGLGFGALTTGNTRLRGAFGCVFGFIGIFFGLIMTYATLIIVGYMSSLSSSVLTPIYLWHEYTVAQFVVMQLLSLNGLFYTFFGLLAAYVVASRLTLKVKSNKKSSSYL